MKRVNLVSDAEGLVARFLGDVPVAGDVLTLFPDRGGVEKWEVREVHRSYGQLAAGVVEHLEATGPGDVYTEREDVTVRVTRKPKER